MSDTATNNERHDAVLVTYADGTQEHIPIPDEMKPREVVISLSPDTIEQLGKAIARAIK